MDQESRAAAEVSRAHVAYLGFCRGGTGVYPRSCRRAFRRRPEMHLEEGNEKDRKTYVAKVLKYVVEILRFVKFVASPLKSFSDNEIFRDLSP